jgi:hypothetical protein
MQNNDGVWTLVLTNSQRLALVDLILEQMAARGASAAFVDVAASKVTKPLELLEAIDCAQWTTNPTPYVKKAGSPG